MDNLIARLASGKLTRLTIATSILAIVFAATVLFATPASAATAKAKGKIGSAATSQKYVKSSTETNVKGAKVSVTIQPAAKGGKKSKAGEGQADFDNFSSWIVQCYVDGTFVGNVAPYGDLNVFVGTGNHTVYAQAVFTDGSIKYWGGTTFWFGYEDWQLYP